jgi:hypothetical protein
MPAAQAHDDDDAIGFTVRHKVREAGTAPPRGPRTCC